MYKKVKMESNAMKTTGGLRYLQHSPSELESYMIPQLQRIQEQLRCDLNKVEQVCISVCVLLLYVHRKQLWSNQDGQWT